MSLISKIARVASANIVQVIVGVVLGFVLPMVLTVDAYADYKTFTLMVGYIGFFHLGFVDGLYVDYAGKKLQELNRPQLRAELFAFVVAELLFTAILLVAGLAINNTLLVLLALAVVPYNLNTFYKRVYQSTDRLRLYSETILISSVANAVICLVFVAIFGFRDSSFYCLAAILSNLIVCCVETRRMMRMMAGSSRGPFDIKRYKRLVASGFIILLGNLAVNLFYGIDRWVVRLAFSTEEFAYYSFAISMMNIATTVLQAVSITFFNYLAVEKDGESIRKTKDLVLSLGMIATLVYFPLCMVVSAVLEQYVPSLSIIAISMAAFPFMAYINAVTINLYKLRGKEKRYLATMVAMLLVMFALDIAVLPLHNYELIAATTLVCYVGWYFWSRCEEKDNDPLSIREVLYLSLGAVLYLVLTHSGVNALAFVVYALSVLLMTTLYLYPHLRLLIGKGRDLK